MKNGEGEANANNMEFEANLDNEIAQINAGGFNQS